jgi:hypothetical protein
MIYATQPREPRAQSDPKAAAAPKTNALVAEQFAFQTPKRNAPPTYGRYEPRRTLVPLKVYVAAPTLCTLT